MLCALGALACAKGTPIEEGDLIISPLRPDAGEAPPQPPADAGAADAAPSDGGP